VMGAMSGREAEDRGAVPLEQRSDGHGECNLPARWRPANRRRSRSQTE
jgi:hypothetical protein